MKKIIFIFIILIVLLGVGYLILRQDGIGKDQNLSDEYLTYSKADVGLEFRYRAGPTGYVLDERMPVDLGTPLIRVIILEQSVDKLAERPVGGEGPAVITIAVFENSKKQFPGVWAEENVQFSNINLKTSDVSEAVIGGANAIRYMADGLYASENAVIADGQNIYVVTGQFIDEDSDLRRDFAPLLDSIRFIPQLD